MRPRRLLDDAGAAAAESPWAGRAGVASLFWLVLWLLAWPWVKGLAERAGNAAGQLLFHGVALAGMLSAGFFAGVARPSRPPWRGLLCWSAGLVATVAVASWLVQLGADWWNGHFPGHSLPPMPGLPAWRELGWRARGTFLLSALVVGPAFEELLFRGVLAGLVTRAFGATAGVAVSAVLFGLAHGVTPAVVPLVLFGVLQCWARPRVGLAGLAVAHGVYNAVAIGVSMLAA